MSLINARFTDGILVLVPMGFSRAEIRSVRTTVGGMVDRFDHMMEIGRYRLLGIVAAFKIRPQSGLVFLCPSKADSVPHSTTTDEQN